MSPRVQSSTHPASTAVPTLGGVWIGNTRDEDVTHEWRIIQRDEHAFIYATLDEQGTETYYSARVTRETMLINGSPDAIAQFVDAEHFVLAHWQDDRDMLFSCEGLAELTAASAWARYDLMIKQRDQL